MPVALQLQAAWETACKASLPRSAHKHLNDVWSISVDCGLAKVLGGASVGSTSEAVLDSATGRRNDVLRRAKLPLPWDAATAREVVGFLLTELRLTDPAVVDAVLRQCREPKAARSRDVVRVRQLFEAYESAFLCWGNLPNYGLYGNYSPDRHDEERVYAGFRAFLRSDARHFMVPFGSKRAVAEHALRMAHLWRIYRGEAAVLAGDPAAALAHAEALRQAFEAPCLGSLWGLSESAQFTALLRTQPAVLLESKRALAELPGFGADYVNRLMRRNPGLLTLGAREVETRWHALVAATDLRWEWRQERRMWMDLDVTRAWNYITGPKSHDIGTVLEGADEQRCARLHYVDAMCEKSEFRCSRHSAAELLLMRTEMLDSVAARAKYAVPFAEWRCRL